MTWSSWVRVESQELSRRIESLVCKLVSMLSHTEFHVFSTTFFAIKWSPKCYKMVSAKLENGAQCCFNKFDCRLFMYNFSQFAFQAYLSLSLSVVSKSLAQPCRKHCSISCIWHCGECVIHHERDVHEHRCTEVPIFGDAKNFCQNLILFFPNNVQTASLNLKTKTYHCKQIKVSAWLITNCRCSKPYNLN